jgi:hypothetical protein
MTAPKSLTNALTFVLLGVWGAVGYQVYTAAFAGDPDRAESGPSSAPVKTEPYVYVADGDDPFQVIVPATLVSKKVREVIPWTPPPVKVTGILSGKGRPTAIVEGAAGDISFLGEGDTTCGVKILKIRDGLVVYSYRKEKKEWTLDGRQ